MRELIDKHTYNKHLKYRMDINSNHNSSPSRTNKSDRKNVQEMENMPDRHEVVIRSPRGNIKNEDIQNNQILMKNKKTSQFSVSPRPRKSTAHKDDEQVSQRADSIGPSNDSTVYDEAVSRYQCIANLTEQENENLRAQNAYLVEKLRKMQQRQARVKKIYEKAKKFKTLYEEAQMQIQVLKDECQIYKQQAQQMKKIVLNDVYRLKQKVIETGIEESVDLTQAKQKKSQIASQASTQNKSGRKSSQSSLSKYMKYPQQII